MAQQNIIEEYLVKLGFAPTDTAGLARFNQTLLGIASSVDNTFFKTTKSVIGFQAVATSALAGVGLAAVKFAENVAMADQDYRLLALHMYTTLPVARSLKIALDALGQPLENVQWDPELAARFHQLILDQREMVDGLGPGFEGRMQKIRDVTFEFQRMGVEMKLLGMSVVNNLMIAFGPQIDFVLGKLREFNAYIIQHIPEIARWISDHLAPVFRDLGEILRATMVLLKEFAPIIEAIPWEKMIHFVAMAAVHIIELETNFLKLFKTINDGRKWLYDAVMGNTADRDKDYGDIQKDINGQIPMNNPFSAFGSTLKGEGSSSGSLRLSGSDKIASSVTIQNQIIQQAKLLGVDPALALAVAQQESQFKQFNNAGGVTENPDSGALGIMQLMPKTAEGLHVNPRDEAQNILGGVTLLKQLLDRYKGNEFLALSHYGGRGGSESQDYARQVMAREGNINIEINVQTNADPKQIGNEVRRALNDAQQARIQRNNSELNTGYGY